MIVGPKLIFVDGIVGSGKSRLAQRLWLHLRKSGCDVEWFAEPQSGHPLHDLGDLSTLDAEGAIAVALRAWLSFVAERRATVRVTLLDATLLQATSRFLLAYGIPQSEWQLVLKQILCIAEPLAPALVYLRPNDPASAIDRIASTRGAEWRSYMESMFEGSGRFAGMKAHYVERLRQDLELIGDLDLSCLILISDRDGWDERYVAVCEFLGLDLPEPADSFPGDIALLADRYREPVSGVSWELQLSDGRLGFCTGDRPHLMHVEGTRFVVEGRPLEAEFTLDACGHATSLRFSGPFADDPLPGTEWHRVAG
jgi:thymidylate kinase